MYLPIGSCFVTYITLTFSADIQVIETALKYQRQGASSMLIHIAASNWMSQALKPFSRHPLEFYGYS
jgi:hypothetical protein